MCRPIIAVQKWSWGSCGFERTRPINASLQDQTKIFDSLRTNLKSAESEYIVAFEELDEQKERSQCLLERLKIQQGTVATLDRELKTPDVATKLSENLGLYHPKHAPIDSITKRLRKLSLLCHPHQGRIQKAFGRLQRAHRILADWNASDVYEVEGCEAADNVFSSKNNKDSWTLSALGRQQRINFPASPYFVLASLFGLLSCFVAVKLTFL